MAKKSRTPLPPRKVQSPKQRTQAREGLSDRQRRAILYAGAGTGLLGIVVAVLLIAATGGGASDKGVAAALAKAGCTYNVYPAHSQKHVTSLKAKVKYNSFPPSNGSHYFQPALWGNYSDPVEQVQAVHNLEHGGMLIEYGSKVPSSTVAQISAFYSESPNAMLVFPYAPLGKRIAFVAWTADQGKLQSRSATGGYHGEGRVSVCTSFDEAAKTFRDHFRGKGPERYPVSALTPGT